MATGMVTPSQGAAKALSRAWGQKSIGRVFGHTALLFISVKWFKEFLRVSCCLLSSHLTERWKRLEEFSCHSTNNVVVKTLDQHQQLHFTISHSFRDVRPKANLQNPTKVVGCDINNGVPQQTVDPCLGFLGSIRTTWHSISSREPKIGSCKFLYNFQKVYRENLGICKKKRSKCYYSISWGIL